MPNFLRFALLYTLVGGAFISTSAQTVLWQETFEGLPDGTTVDTGPTAWVADQTNLKAGGIWSVDNGTLLARNVVNNNTGCSITITNNNGTTTYNNMNCNSVTWESEVIDISAAVSGIRIFAEISAATVAQLENQDYIRLQYSVDGGAYTDFDVNPFAQNDYGRLVGASSCDPIVVGNTLRIRITVANTTVNEFYRIDNVTVVDASNPALTLPGITHSSVAANGNWNTAATWQQGTVPNANSVVEIACGCVVQFTDDRSARAVVVQPGGVLVWTADNADLTFTNGGNNALIINSAGALGEVILGGGFAGANNSRIRLESGNSPFPITNNSSIADIDQFQFLGGDKDVTLTGIGRFELREIEFNTTAQSFTNASTVLTDEIDENVNSNPVFINAAGGRLELRGTGNDPIDDDVVLNASAIGNTVFYLRAGNQDVQRPVADTYYNLVLEESGVKSTNAEFNGGTAETVTVLGDLTIADNAVFDVDAGNENIALHGNWTNSSAAGTPFDAGNGTETVSLVGSADQSVTRTLGTEGFNRVVVNKPGGQVLLGSPVNIADDMNFTQGVVQSTAANILRFADDATVQNASNASFTDGPVEKVGNDAFVFPVGDGGVYRPLSLPAPDNVLDAFRAQYFNTGFGSTAVNAPLLDVVPDFYWTLDQPTTSGGADTPLPTLAWTNIAPYGYASPAEVMVAQFSGGAWNDLAQSLTTGTLAGTGAVTAGTPFNFSGGPVPLTLGSSDFLPVEMLSFTGQAVGQVVELDWATANETDNFGFWVQRSANGTDGFETLDFVAAVEAPQPQNQYAYTDQTPIADVNYYRLAQQDFDGTLHYSNVVEVRFGTATATAEITVFPNPTAGKLTVRLPETGGPVTWDLLDLTGRTITGATVEQTGANLQLDLSSAGVANGTYFVRVTNGNNAWTERIVVQ